MTSPMQPLRRPPIAFAHRGARAHAPENTLPSFQLALRLGATGLESDVWLTADGVPVLDHDGFTGGRLRRRPIAAVPRTGLESHIPSLEELYAECGTAFELSLDIKDAGAIGPVVEIARMAGALDRLWVCHHDMKLVAAWRALSDDVHLVDSTRLKRIREGPERRAANLADAGIDAINMHASDWTGGLTTLFHRFGRLAFGWDAQHDRVIRSLLTMGIDAVYSDHPDRLSTAITDFSR
jgi:glycerophosphoryl diester phosphodiesterase